MPQSLNDVLPFRSREPILPDLRNLVRVIEERLKKIEAKAADFDAAEKALLAVGLTRLDTVLGPAVERIVGLADLGFLSAPSHSGLNPSIHIGDTVVMNIDAGVQRENFHPTA